MLHIPPTEASGHDITDLGPLWDELDESVRKDRLDQLGLGQKPLFWFELSEKAQRKIFNAWRRWSATCE